MAIATWRRMAPANTAPFLDAYAKQAKLLGDSISGIGEEATDYADNKSEAETNAFIQDLMTAGSQEERDAMISAANQSWLNLEKVNATNYELGQPERDLAVKLEAEKREQEAWEERLELTRKSNIQQHTEELANTLLYDQEVYNTITKPEQIAEEEAKKAEEKRKAEEAKAKRWKPVDDPLTLEDGYFQDRYGWNTNPLTFAWGPAFDEPDLREIMEYRAAFVNRYSTDELKTKNLDISQDDFNRFLLSNKISFNDNWTKDNFTFAHESNYGLDIQGNEEKLYKEILSFKDIMEEDKIMEAWNFQEFRTNNVKAFGSDFDWENPDNLLLAEKVFMEIQKDDTIPQDKKTHAISAERINEIRSNIVSKLETKLKDDLVNVSDIPINSEQTPFALRHLETMDDADIADLKKELLTLYEATDGELPDLKLETLRLILENASK